ncbi:hypothetical protein [Streptomyces sp. NPDC048737]|uniref:hypothetical protein n=1 Tax=unclassified Streptomyces TaxID=2593676 RepID=UPI003421A115
MAAGRQWRRRGATASLWVVLSVAALASVWGWAAWYLGDLRARIVFRDAPDGAWRTSPARWAST